MGKRLIRNKGITLIALVITIIVLLILAGVSIAMLTGENGILNQAQEAKEQTKISELKERLQLIGMEARQKNNKLLKGEEFIVEYEAKIKQDEIFKVAQVEREDLKITVTTKEGYIFEITENNVEYIGKTNEDISILGITITCSDVSNKVSKLTAEINKNNNRKYEYKIYINDKEVETITTKEKSFSYEIATEFGKSKIYVKANAIDKEIQSNQVEIEDNSVKTFEELKRFRDEVNSGNTYEGKTISQISNIDMKNENWVSIGNTNAHFKGTYDGNGNYVANIYMNNKESDQGLFGVNEGTIKNIGIESGTINAGANTGGIVGINKGGNVERCYNKAEINAEGSWLGGICGDNQQGTILECYNNGKITGIITTDYGRACGIAGSNFGGTIKACYNTGEITTITEKQNARAAGITDTTYYSVGSKTISCYNTGTIKIEAKNKEDVCPVSAGIITQTEGEALVENCYNIGNTMMDAANGPEASEMRRAGITGYLFASATIRNCYWMTGTANQGWGADSEEGADTSGILEKSSEEMKKLETILGTDFKKDTNNINNGYPILYWQ